MSDAFDKWTDYTFTEYTEGSAFGFLKVITTEQHSFPAVRLPLSENIIFLKPVVEDNTITGFNILLKVGDSVGNKRLATADQPIWSELRTLLKDVAKAQGLEISDRIPAADASIELVKRIQTDFVPKERVEPTHPRHRKAENVTELPRDQNPSELVVSPQTAIGAVNSTSYAKILNFPVPPGQNPPWERLSDSNSDSPAR